jgi:hypothetical protein
MQLAANIAKITNLSVAEAPSAIIIQPIEMSA